MQAVFSFLVAGPQRPAPPRAEPAAEEEDATFAAEVAAPGKADGADTPEETPPPTVDAAALLAGLQPAKPPEVPPPEGDGTEPEAAAATGPRALAKPDTAPPAPAPAAETEALTDPRGLAHPPAAEIPAPRSGSVAELALRMQADLPEEEAADPTGAEAAVLPAEPGPVAAPPLLTPPDTAATVASPLPAAVAPTDTPPPHRQAAEALATHLAQATQTGQTADSGAAAAPDGTVEIILQPEELGRVRFELRQDGERVTVQVQAERADTLALMRRHAQDLVAEMGRAGFGSASLSFSQGGGGSGRNTGAPPAEDSLPDIAAPAPPAPPRPATRASGALDLRL